MTYISIRQIMDNLLDNDMMKGLSLERAVNYAVEFQRIVGIPSLFENKIAKLEVNNYRVLLPCDFYEMVQVKKCKDMCLIYSLDDFNSKGEYSYKIQGNVLITSFRDGLIEIAYRAMPVDDEGFPKIVDNGSYPRALELYIKKRWYTNLFDSGKISQAVLQNTQQEYAWAVGQASSDLIRPTLDQMESIKNMWCTLLQKNNEHISGFKHTDLPEHLKL